MYIFNQFINEFIDRQQKRLDQICKESYLKRFSVKIVVYNKSFRLKQTIGFYDHSQRLIGLHQSLMLEAQEKVDEVLKHEYAHFLSIKEHGENIQSHGPEFAFYCKRLGIPATATEKDPSYFEKIEKNKVLEKIKKLLDLGSSPNEHEAELATAKANQLLMKYNLSLDNLNKTNEIYMEIVGAAPRSNSYLNGLQDLMKHFNVYAISTKRNKTTYLEIAGDSVNVEIAKYVADFFTKEHVRLWKIAQKEHGLKGLRDKNSFIYGLVRGFCSKITKVQKEEFNEEEIKTLTIYNEETERKAKSILYPKTRSVKYGTFGNPTARELGVDAGKKMNINPAITKNNNEIKRLN